LPLDEVHLVDARNRRELALERAGTDAAIVTGSPPGRLALTWIVALATVGKSLMAAAVRDDTEQGDAAISKLLAISDEGLGDVHGQHARVSGPVQPAATARSLTV